MSIHQFRFSIKQYKFSQIADAKFKEKRFPVWIMQARNDENCLLKIAAV